MNGRRHDNGPDKAFYDVCHNEIFASCRDMNEALGTAARAILEGDEKMNFAGIEDWEIVPRQRAGYLLQFLCGWAEADVYDRFQPMVSRLAQSVADQKINTPFFHDDKPAGHDRIADAWGLTRGVEVDRLKKLITPPYIV